MATANVDAGEGHMIATWRFGAAPRRILLVQGWEGRGAQLGSFVDPLLDAGFEVVLFDHIGHGESVGKRSSMIRFRDGIRAVEAAMGPFHGCVAHSWEQRHHPRDGWRGHVRARGLRGAPWDLAGYIERFVALRPASAAWQAASWSVSRSTTGCAPTRSP